MQQSVQQSVRRVVLAIVVLLFISCNNSILNHHYYESYKLQTNGTSQYQERIEKLESLLSIPSYTDLMDTYYRDNLAWEYNIQSYHSPDLNYIIWVDDPSKDYLYYEQRETDNLSDATTFLTVYIKRR